jgi:hypothetical protein
MSTASKMNPALFSRYCASSTSNFTKRAVTLHILNYALCDTSQQFLELYGEYITFFANFYSNIALFLGQTSI